MDSNDIAVPNRLEKQVAYLNSHPEIGVLSGDMCSMDAEGNLLDEISPYAQEAGHYVLVWSLLWTNPIAHITIMMRRSVLAEQGITYRTDFNRAEDYELWATLARHTRLHRLPEVYARRRVLPEGVSFAHRNLQLAVMYRVAEREIRQVLGHLPQATALKTMWDMVHRLPEEQRFHHYTGAAWLVARVYHLLIHEPLSMEEERIIRGQAIAYLYKLARRAGQNHYRMGGWYALFMLLLVSPREFFSRTMLRTAWGVVRGHPPPTSKQLVSS